MLLPINTYTGGGLIPAMDPASAITICVSLPAAVVLAQGTAVGQIVGSGTDVNEVQTLTGSGLSGTYQIAYDGEYTTALSVGATAATVQAAMEALPSIGTGNCTVTGGPLTSAPLVFTFAGAGATAGKHHPLMTLTNPTAGTLAFALTTLGCPAGGYYDAYSASAAGVFAGLATMKGFLHYSVRTNSNGQIFYGTEKNLADHRHFDRAADIFISGTFKASDLTGIDAAGVTSMGGVYISGTSALLTSANTLIRFG